MTLSLYTDEEHGWTESPRPRFSTFAFTPTHNCGKILDKEVVNSGTSYKVNSVSRLDAEIDGSEISLTIPYLYDFRLTPSFTVADGTEVTVNGMPQISGESVQDFSGPVKYIVSAGGDSHTYIVRISNSGLPVVVIEQSSSGDFSDDNEGNIFVKRIRNTFLDFKIRKKSSEWVKDDRFTVYNPDGTVNLTTQNCGVRQRGNSTRKYPKKALGIKLADSKQPVLGMPQSKRWVLLANWIDHSMIRNASAFALAQLIGQAISSEGLQEGTLWQPHGRNVELVIDGRHVGNYFLCEQIKIEKTRLNINDSFEDRKEDGKTTAFADCGFLLEFDQSYDEPWKFRTSTRNLPVQIKDDIIGSDAEGKQHWAQIQNIINGIETDLTTGNFTSAFEALDIYSVIDQWFVNELTQNREYTEPRSMFFYINAGGKLKGGPVWDFDRGTFHNPIRAKEMGNESNRVKPYDVWLSEYSTGNTASTPGLWYPLLIKSPEFRAAVKERWNRLFPYLSELPATIISIAESNRISWEYNNRMWPTNAEVIKAGNDNNTFKDWSGDEWMTDYDEVIENMVNCYINRLESLNALIVNL